MLLSPCVHVKLQIDIVYIRKHQEASPVPGKDNSFRKFGVFRMNNYA